MKVNQSAFITVPFKVIHTHPEYVVSIALTVFQSDQIVILFQAIILSCLAFNAVARFALSEGCQVKLENDTTFQWLEACNQTDQSYIKKSHTLTSPVNSVEEAVHVYVTPLGISCFIGAVVSNTSTMK